MLSSARDVAAQTLPSPAEPSFQNIQVEGPHNFWLQKLFNRYFTLTATHSDREGNLLLWIGNKINVSMIHDGGLTFALQALY